MYWEKAVETMPLAALRTLQEERLRHTLTRACRSPYYQKLFYEHGIGEQDVITLGELDRLPFTTKQDLRDGYPYGFLTIDREEIVRLHSSSGTTGQATVIFHSSKDIRDWANVMARCMYMAGMRKSDIFQNMTAYGMFTGGLGFHYGAELLGALTVPAGSGNSKRQLHFMQDFETSVLHVIPSYALHLLSVFEDAGVSPKDDLHLRIAFLGAEPHTEYTRQRVEQALGVKAFNSYGLSEMYGPGVAFECREQTGMHIWEDYFLAEVIDPETLEAVEDGVEGELVLTTLTREAMPLIRYRTRDLTMVIPEPCPCGRTHKRIARIKGRSDDMIIVKGVNVFPMQIEKVLMSIPEVGKNYRIELQTVEEIDVMTVNVEVHNNVFLGDIKCLRALQQKITAALRAELLFTPKVSLVEPDSIPKAPGKAIRVIDRRNVH
ncbi:phenylacetate--CoA ligase [candidate division KSB3 bacterium]|uniref:Phenylacetate-coenzyme A ligase n=1 Tax=candidate division KSB3 bacterium TaxID=2044937 RepID=A0A2G6EAJ8_9BACT|nr:MAG: phenylacetate--CoA ligase [candidate division KSB3 bacterium]PIE30754.1 MAG: phenylacetate--CoA ligase [candidate division KSB3 bacterium]